MKTCIHCGATLEDNASFCPVCAKPQNEPTQYPIPKILSRKLLYCAVALLILILAASAILLRHRPRTYDAGDTGELVYESDGKTWHLLLRNSVTDTFHWREPQPVYSRLIESGQQAALPLQLNIYDEKTQENAASEFAGLIDHSEITFTSLTGTDQLEISSPQANPAFPQSVFEADVVYHSDCGNNQITWTLHMKNGDVLVLNEAMELRVRPEVSYSYKDTPMETAEDLNRLFVEIDETVDPEALVIIDLPPVTYEEDVKLGVHSFKIHGSSEGNTVFHKQFIVPSQSSGKIDLYGCTFEGAASGVRAYFTVFLDSCTFKECETAVLGVESSWPSLMNCTLENCRTGLIIDCPNSTSHNALYQGNTFRGNKTAVLLEKLPGEDVLYFIDCIFEDNGTDIDNRTGNEIKDSF